MGLLRQLFGPSQEEIWQQLAEDLGADYEDGGFWQGRRLIAHVDEWRVIMDTYTISTGQTSTTYTRLRAPFINADGFRFDIFRHNLFSELGRYLGMTDIAVGHPWFDAEFVIRSNDEARCQAFFADSRIRELVQEQPDVRLTVKDDEGWFGPDFPEDVDELYFCCHDLITNRERLRHLFELFSCVLHRLCHYDSAYERDPGLEL